MGWWTWLPAVSSTVFGVLEIAATIGVGITCPPLAPVVGGALSIGGGLLNEVISNAAKKAEEADEAAHQSGITDEQYEEMRERLEDVNYVVQKNEKILRKNQDYILKNRRSILDNQDHILENRNQIRENRDYILDNKDHIRKNGENIQLNQEYILQNRDEILENRDYILDNKDHILQNRKHILENQDYILDNKDHILQNRKNIQKNQEYILQNKDHILGNRDYIMENQDFILENQRLIVGVEGILNATAEENRMMMKDMAISLKSFEENVERNFEELKNFMVEKDFVEKIELPLDSLWKKMKIACEIQNKRVLNAFVSSYKELSARKILDHLLDRMDHTHTNPITSAMQLNILKSRDIINHYMHLFSSIVVKVLAIEGFYYGASGGSKKGTKAYMDELSEHIDYAVNTMRDMLINIKIPREKFWPGLVNQTAVASNEKTNLGQIADKIKAQLNGIFTKDVFSIFVFRCVPGSCYSTPLVTHSVIPDDVGDDEAESIIHDREASFMLEQTNAETNVMVVVMRSEPRNVSQEVTNTLLTGYRSFQALRHKWHKVKCGDGEVATAFIDIMNAVLSIEEMPDGFVVCNGDGVVEERLTGNRQPIISKYERELLPHNHLYYGLAWV